LTIIVGIIVAVVVIEWLRHRAFQNGRLAVTPSMDGVWASRVWTALDAASASAALRKLLTCPPSMT
jgi:hypothetical protein